MLFKPTVVTKNSFA